MFEGDLTIRGRHATYAKSLKDETKMFLRIIDVYMTGVVLGARYQRIGTPDESTDRVRIYADAFNTERAKCKELFRLVILNDTLKGWTDEQKINICFRYRDHEDDQAIPAVTSEEISIMQEAEELFNSYAFGGIEILHKLFSENVPVNEDEIIDVAYQSLDENYLAKVASVDDDDSSDLLRPEY